MADCDINIDSYQSEDGELSVIDKYTQLMIASLGDDSVYERIKDTLFHHFNNLQLSEKEKAGYILDFMSTFTNEISKVSMGSALAWSKEERDGGYALAKTKADTEASLANYELTKEEICKTQKETSLLCAQITASSAASLRDNGTPTIDPSNGCTVLYLEDEGLKYEQTQQVKAATYQTFADAYRKSGVVEIGIDVDDQVKKGLTGDLDGYTWQQQTNAERQRIAYEDSKVNHAANSSASMIGQMLAAEVGLYDADITAWRSSINKLLTRHSTTDTD